MLNVITMYQYTSVAYSPLFVKIIAKQYYVNNLLPKIEI